MSEEAKNKESCEYINTFNKLANECVMTTFCHRCFEPYHCGNPKYEDYPICTLCASKVAVMVLAETVAKVMSGKVK